MDRPKAFQNRLHDQKTYWTKQLISSPCLEMPFDRPRPPVQAFIRGQESIELTKNLCLQLKRLCTQTKISPFVALLTTFKILVLRMTGHEDVVVGSFSSDSVIEEKDQKEKVFWNPVGLRTNLAGDPSGHDLLTRVTQTVEEAAMNRNFPFETLVQELGEGQNLSRAPIFQMMFMPGNMPSGLSDVPFSEQDLLESEEQAARCDLVVLASYSDAEECIQLRFDYDAELFESSTIKRMMGHYQSLLYHMVDTPGQRISTLEYLSEIERHQLLLEWNPTQTDFNFNGCVHQLIELQTDRSPDASAAVFEEQTLTYGELNRRANQLAHHLRKHGVGPEVLVGICMKPSLEMLIGLLGILKAGGAYVPLNPTYPSARLAWMIEDACIPVLVTQEDLLKAFSDSNNLHRICLKKERHIIEQELGDNPDNQTMPDNLVYVMYTSGSTGRPKGVMITHRAIGNRLTWWQKTFHVTETDKILQKDSVTFDTSVWKFFGPLFVGAQVVIAPSGAPQDPGWLVALISQHQITLTGWTPSALHMFLEEPGSETCHSLSQILCGGESLPPSVQEKFLASQNGKLFNLYGPTEASIDSTIWPCTPQHNLGTIPIGRPIANTQVYVLDKHFKPVPIGVPGDLYIGGIGLARGYNRRKDLTGERFIPHPFNKNPGTRLYKAGDIAAYKPDGNLEFLGRRDQQVKLRGYRIELGEVEATLIQHSSVQEAVVLLREDRSGEKRIVAYVILEQEDPLPIATLRNHLRQQLPNYMIPSVFVSLDALPLTLHGKVDRQALPVPDEDTVERAEQFVAPITPLESLLQQLWQDVLGIKPIGLHDNFFMLGGHSLLAFKLMVRIRKNIQETFPVRAIFDHPTLESLAKFITEQDDVSLDQPSQPGLSIVDSRTLDNELNEQEKS